MQLTRRPSSVLPYRERLIEKPGEGRMKFPRQSDGAPADGTTRQPERDEAQRELFAAIDEMRTAFAAVPPVAIEREGDRAITAIRREDRSRVADLGGL